MLLKWSVRPRVGVLQSHTLLFFVCFSCCNSCCGLRWTGDLSDYHLLWSRLSSQVINCSGLLGVQVIDRSSNLNTSAQLLSNPLVKLKSLIPQNLTVWSRLVSQGQRKIATNMLSLVFTETTLKTKNFRYLFKYSFQYSSALQPLLATYPSSSRASLANSYYFLFPCHHDL